MTRHFIWLTPLANLLVFFGLGLLLALVTRLRPRMGGWLSPRLLCALAVRPAFLVAFPQVFGDALFILALGIAFRLAPLFERRPVHAAAAAFDVSRSGGIGADPGRVRVRWRLAQGAARSRPCPAANRFPQRALHCARHGTGPSPEPLRLPTPHVAHAGAAGQARGSIRRGRATESWTLPSHASFFTGHLAHEFGVEW